MSEPERVRAADVGKCPRCKVALNVMAHEGFKGAGCLKCEGIWLGAKDLSNAIRSYGANRGVALKTIALLEAPARPSGLRCPQCSSALESISLRAVEVEKCPSCRGVFLDRGEKEAIAERVLLAKATWEPAHQELMLAVFERMANERARRGGSTGGVEHTWHTDPWYSDSGSDGDS